MDYAFTIKGRISTINEYSYNLYGTSRKSVYIALLGPIFAILIFCVIFATWGGGVSPIIEEVQIFRSRGVWYQYFVIVEFDKPFSQTTFIAFIFINILPQQTQNKQCQNLSKVLLSILKENSITKNTKNDAI